MSIFWQRIANCGTRSKRIGVIILQTESAGIFGFTIFIITNTGYSSITINIIECKFARGSIHFQDHKFVTQHAKIN